MKKLTYNTVFKGACGTGSREFTRAFPTGAPSEAAIVRRALTKRPDLMGNLPFYMTSVARRLWRETVSDYTNSSLTDFDTLNTRTQQNIVKAFLSKVETGVNRWNKKTGLYDYLRPDSIFKGTRKVA